MIPATYNFSYYRGDTFNFSVAPKDQDGNPVDLSAYTAAFVIASERGAAPAFSLVADTSIVSNVINCELTAADGATLTGGTTYVYDVKVFTAGSAVVHTYLTGNFVVTNDVADS